MRKLVLATVAISVAVAFFLLAILPPAPADLPVAGVDPALAARTVAGAYHVHTNRSDGAGDKAAVCAAAARAGLDFVILTDHGDATRPPDPPEYLHGVLCIDAVEISTNGGHYVALGLPVAPYPLGGEASAVVEDVARLGGFGVAAHPDHPRPELTWTEWDAPIDGLEWINADAEWRDESSVRLAFLLVAYLFRPAPALASVFDRPAETLARWDDLARDRAVVSLAAVDAHGGATGNLEEGKPPVMMPGPAYEASFRSLSNRVILDAPLSGEAVADGARVLESIRQGRVYSVVDGLASNVLLQWSEERGFEPASPLPEGVDVQRFTSGGRARLEIYLPGAPGEPMVPWVLTNWSGPRPAAQAPELVPPSDGVPLALASEWRVEKDPLSSGSISGEDKHVSLAFRLHDEGRSSQFVGTAADLRIGEPFRALRFQARASRPMRVSAQLRFPPDDRRWGRSFYLDQQGREVTIDLDALRPAEGRGPMPAVSSARSLLFVADLVNARPGDSGSFTISDLRVVR